MRKTHLMVLAIVAVAVVLAAGAVAAYADITTDSQAPVTTTDAVASYWNTAAITATATDAEGIAWVYNQVDGGVVRLTPVSGKPTSTPVTVPGAKDLPLAAGKHTIKYWAQDINGNVEVRKSVTFTVAVDKAAPSTTATGATNGAWYKAGVTVHIVAADGVGESGVKELSYALDGAAAIIVSGATADVAVPAVDGPHTIVYHATDVAENVAVDKTMTVNVDTKKPTTSALSAAAVVKGRTATLKYKVTDAVPNGGKATVEIKIKSRAGKFVKTIKVGRVAVNATLSAKFACSLARGTYTFLVYATDMAGNAQAKIGSNRLTVK